MSRLQLALNVADLDAAVEFYSTLFRTRPQKVKPGYANFTIADPPLKLVLFENTIAPHGSVNHLGVEVESTADVAEATGRLREAGLDTLVEDETTCCYATQDKVWVTDPGGARWEVYTVLADAEEFGTSAPIPAVETAVAVGARTEGSRGSNGSICCS